jgi:hypothetical protein
MSTVAITADSQAIVLLCSTLALPRGATVKPLTPKEWSSFAASIQSRRYERRAHSSGSTRRK